MDIFTLILAPESCVARRRKVQMIASGRSISAFSNWLRTDHGQHRDVPIRTLPISASLLKSIQAGAGRDEKAVTISRAFCR